MDLNDINIRLKRAYNAINKRYVNDINSALKVSLNQKGKVFSVTFGNYDDVELYNIVFNQVSAIASLKDHLKKYLKNKSKDPQMVEDLINKELVLQLIIDLWNQDKHGYPLSRVSRSNKNPKIMNLKQGLTIKDISKGKGSIVFSPISVNSPDSMKNMTAEVDNTIVKVIGDVTDDKGNILMTLDEMIDQSLRIWEKVIIDNNTT